MTDQEARKLAAEITQAGKLLIEYMNIVNERIADIEQRLQRVEALARQWDL